MKAQAQRGVVLLSVLLILALLSALVYQLMSRHSLLIAQARQTFAGDQALSFALGGEAFARQLLFQDWSETGQGVDTLQESWAQPLAPFEVDNGFLEVQIRDLNSCFNLNSLLETQGNRPGEQGGNQPAPAPIPPATTGNSNSPVQNNLTRFKTLLRNQNIPETVADVWKDWIDADEEISGFGAEDGEYLLYPVPYRSANQAAMHVSELALLRDIEPEYLQILSQVTCVLPVSDLKLNVNTADAATLASLSPSLSESQMQALTESLREYESVAAVTSEYPDLVPAASALTVTSSYFEILVRAQVDDSLVETASVLHRDAENGTIRLIMRDFGKPFRSLYSEESVPVDES
jgi:general secretion pathway protein K